MPTKSRMPFRGLVDTFAEMNRMRDAWRHPYPGEGAGEPRGHAVAWVPTTDIFARGQDIVIRCELAGVTKDEIEITYSSGTLVIWGERSHAPEDDAGELRFYVQERRYGTFSRTINFPEGIDKHCIRASFDDGLLEVTVAGAAAPQEVEEIAIGGDDEGPVELEVGAQRRQDEPAS
jgi:HSP20 family protein